MFSFGLFFYWWISLDCEFVIVGESKPSELEFRVLFWIGQRVMSPREIHVRMIIIMSSQRVKVKIAASMMDRSFTQ